MKESSSETSRTTRYLMSQEERILKVKRLLSGTNMEEETRDGKLSMLTSLMQKIRKELIHTSDSTEIEYSTSSQDSQCTELFKLTATTISNSTNGRKTTRHNNGSSTQSRRLLETITGRTTAWKSQAMVTPIISK